MSVVRLSVRAVVEWSLHEHDLCPAAGMLRRMREGTLAHRARQEAGRRNEQSYHAETALAGDYVTPELTLHVTGRADGLFERADGMRVVEEIKLGEPDTPLVPAHRAQAAFYGHMLCVRDALPGVCLRILYVDVQGEPLVCYEEEHTAQALRETFDALCAAACAWEAKKLNRCRMRDELLRGAPFPFLTYRPGQRRFAGNVYVAICERRRLFAQAPTGIGKTMAALYPALHALCEGKCARVLYLTARTTGRKSAMEALTRLSGVMAVEIVAKDKVCVQQTRDCRPEVCPRAQGYYDRLPYAMEAALCGGLWGRTQIETLAQEYRLCPFELSLALSQLADVTVCDYNYVYDPFVRMDALFQGGAALLVDEAHQLSARVCDAHSAALSSDGLRAIRRDVGQALGRKHALYKALSGAVHALEELACTPQWHALNAPPSEVTTAMEAVAEAAGNPSCAVAAQALTLALGWQFAASRFDARYAVLTDGGEKHAVIHLSLLCAQEEILARSVKARGTVYFSATLAPFQTAMRMLGSRTQDACLALQTPFDPAQLTARIEPIDIRYAARERTAPQVAAAIAQHIQTHAGNTLVFFPSYAYLARIAELLISLLPGERLLQEARALPEDEKNALLGAMEDGARAVVLCVLGGAFAEGIDLAGDKLKNVIIASTGMPQPDARVRAMRAYFDAQGEDGFFLSMTLPGMVRVNQAAGRLIRTPQDTGSVLLIDSRFAHEPIRALLRGTLLGAALGID